MAEVNLLNLYPKAKRDIKARNANKTDDIIAISRQYGQEYFDGDRKYGYGGYYYDGRWVPIAERIVEHFNLKPGMRVLDIGCAKGFLMKDLMQVCPGLEVYGLDISRYALMHCEPEVIGRIHLGTAGDPLPFPDESFDAVISINALHNLDRDVCVGALKEIERIAPGKAYVQVDAYRNETEKQLFLEWVLTAHTHFYPEGWIELFEEAGYTGDYYWTIVT